MTKTTELSEKTDLKLYASELKQVTKLERSDRPSVGSSHFIPVGTFIIYIKRLKDWHLKWLLGVGGVPLVLSACPILLVFFLVTISGL